MSLLKSFITNIPKPILLLLFLFSTVFSQMLENTSEFVKNSENPSIKPKKIETENPVRKKRISRQPDEDYQLKGKNEFSVWGGFSPDTTTALSFGSSVNARYGTLGIRYARRFDNGNKVNWKYTVDVLPFSNLSFLNTEIVQTAPNRFRIDEVRRNASAFGFVPIGFQTNFRPKKRLKPFLNAGAGILFFNKSVPNEFGKKTNFILEAGGGIEIGLKNNRAVTIGYKLAHISNAYRGELNPGYDNNIFYFGYTFFSK